MSFGLWTSVEEALPFLVDFSVTLIHENRRFLNMIVQAVVGRHRLERLTIKIPLLARRAVAITHEDVARPLAMFVTDIFVGVIEALVAVLGLQGFALEVPHLIRFVVAAVHIHTVIRRVIVEALGVPPLCDDGDGAMATMIMTIGMMDAT